VDARATAPCRTGYLGAQSRGLELVCRVCSNQLDTYTLVNPRRSRPGNFLSREPTPRPPPRRQVKPTSFPADMLARILVAAIFQTFKKAFLSRVFAF
ncbi:hypothetical protein GQ607_005865, partial [Colletotrichum asianum]